MARAKIRLLIAVWASFSMFSCQHIGAREHSSAWAVLDHAGSMDCSPWPLHEHDLEVNDLAVLPGAKVGFIATVRMRTGAIGYYFAPFADDTAIDKDAAVPESFGPSALVSGGGVFDEHLYAAIVQNTSASGLELRQMADNTVAYQTANLGPRVDLAHAVFTSQGIWLSFRRESPETAASLSEGADEPYQVAFAARTSSDSRLRTRPFPGVIFSSAPTLLPTANGVLAVWFDEAQSGGKGGFKIRELFSDGHTGPAANLTLPIKSAVETWAVSADGKGGYLVAMVDGDSLVGQAEIAVAGFNWNGTEAVASVVKSQPLENEHVSEPRWVIRPDGAYLILLKWVDEESTLATYKVVSGEIQPPEVSGVFPKGALVMDAFQSEDKAYAVIRYRNDQRWQFDVCRLSEL